MADYRVRDCRRAAKAAVAAMQAWRVSCYRHSNDFEEPLDPLLPASTTKPAVVKLREHLRPAVTSVILLTLLTGFVFPLVLFALGRLLFPGQAAGSLVTRNGVVIGSQLIGQDFTRPEYFQTRPSAAGTGYSSGGTNLGPSNHKLIENVRALAEDYRRRNGLQSDAMVPIDAVTRSGSGLDPHISPANAESQIARIARVRAYNEEAVRRLVADHTEVPQLGFMGDSRVSVLDLNLALDQAAPLAPR
jgi:potassium-transporting ATPase KdpC subunit